MIAYAFAALAALGVAVVVVAVRYGYGPVEGARKAFVASGGRRVTARQLRHELRIAEHQLAGAAQYIAGLERDRRELSVRLEQAASQLDETKDALTEAEKQLKAFDSTCAENTRLRAELDNARAMRSLHPGPSPADDASALPDSAQEFVDATAGSWRATA
ncbi:hypothetical protein [Streptomyces sp. NPDC094468]|uniref:hypothetical protein n=1 Tax=Streptomyces sp. NPDC094468 TaxID=3366066 RepID=UPI0037F73FE4